MRNLFNYASVFFISLWTLLFLYFQFSSYPFFTNQIIDLLSIDASKTTKFLSIFSPEIFSKLKWLFLALTFFQILVFIISIKKPTLLTRLKQFISPFTEYPQWLWKSFKNLGTAEKSYLLIFLAIVIIHRIWLSSITDVIYDEAWTYLAFTSKNPLLAGCFYPTSNNHILFSHLTQITKLFPFDILTNLRLAALIPNIFAIITFFFCIRNYVKPIIAWCGTVLFSFSFPMVYYGFVARGYSLIVLFFVIGFFSLLQIIQNSDNRKAWHRLVLSSVLGFYSIPIYLYPFVSLFGFAFLSNILLKNNAEILKTIKYGVITCIIILILYTPIFAISGIKSVTSNKYVQSLSYKQLMDGILQHGTKTIQFLTGGEYGYLFFILTAIIILIALRMKLSKNLIYPAVFILLLTPILIFIHKVLPVERTWIYILVPLIFIICLVINKFKWPILILFISFIFSIVVTIHWKKQMLWYDKTCNEDYVEGQIFSTYFHSKNATIITASRMNSYLKFNKLLKNEDWNIEEDSAKSNTKNSYYIFYIDETKPESPAMRKLLTVNNYELYTLK